jgi:hypothetical protein
MSAGERAGSSGFCISDISYSSFRPEDPARSPADIAIAWRPVSEDSLKMTEAASQQALEEGKRRLREFLESSDTGRQAIVQGDIARREQQAEKLHVIQVVISVRGTLLHI